MKDPVDAEAGEHRKGSGEWTTAPHTAERSSETMVETVIPDTKDFKLRPAGSSQKWPQPPFPNALPFFLFTSAKSSYSVSCV